MSDIKPWGRWKGHYSVFEGKPKENTSGTLRGDIVFICQLDDELTVKKKNAYLKRILSIPKLEAENARLQAEVIKLAFAVQFRPAPEPAPAPDLGLVRVWDETNSDGLHVNFEQILGDVHKAIGGLPLDKANALCNALKPHFRAAEQQAVRALGPAPGPSAETVEHAFRDFQKRRMTGPHHNGPLHMDYFEAGAAWAQDNPKPEAQRVLEAARAVSKCQMRNKEYMEILIAQDCAVLALERAEAVKEGDGNGPSG